MNPDYLFLAASVVVVCFVAFSAWRGLLVDRRSRRLAGLLWLCLSAGLLIQGFAPHLSIENNAFVIVDFWAPWCGPCKMLDPIVKQLAQEWLGRVKVVKLDVDENTGLAMQYQVMGVPTLILFVKGQPIQRVTGYQPKDRIASKFSSHF